MNLSIKFNKESGKVAIYDGEKIVAEIVKQETVTETLQYAELFQSSALMHNMLKIFNTNLQDGRSVEPAKENLNTFLKLFTYNK